MSLVVETMQAFKAALLRREGEQLASMTRRWAALENVLQDKVEVFAARVAQDGLTVGQLQSRQFQLDRYASLLRQVQREHSSYVDYADGLIQSAQRHYGQQGINAATAAIRSIAPRLGFDILPINVIENMVGLAGDGLPLQTLLQNSFSAGAQGTLDRLIEATALGYNPQRTARMMVRDGLSQSLSRMMNIARTEQMRVYRQSSMAAYQHSNVVDGARRLSAHDSRVCAGCLAADGQEMALGESFKAHPNCRCTTVPIVKGFAPPQWRQGPAWFAAQPEATQRKILGPQRYAMYKDGMAFENFAAVRTNATWGDAIVPATVQELQRNA